MDIGPSARQKEDGQQRQLKIQTQVYNESSRTLTVQSYTSSSISTYWVASRAVPGPWQQPPVGYQGAEDPQSVRLTDSPTSLAYADETSASPLVPFVSCRFSLLINDSIHPKKTKKKVLKVRSMTVSTEPLWDLFF